MTRVECAGVLAFVSAGIGKPLAKESADVYWDLLKDLPLDVLRTAAKRVMLDHVWNTFPSIAELRRAAAATLLGQIAEMPPAKAWEIAWRAARDIDLEISGPYKARDKNGMMRAWPSQAAMVLEQVPGVVVQAMNAFGLAALCYGQEPVTVVRGQFMKMFEQVSTQRARLALMPAALVKDIEAKSPASLPAVAHNALSQIGVEK